MRVQSKLKPSGRQATEDLHLRELYDKNMTPLLAAVGLTYNDCLAAEYGQAEDAMSFEARMMLVLRVRQTCLRAYSVLADN